MADITSCARNAAKLYGQDWAALPDHSRQIWTSAVREPNSGQTRLEQCVNQAVNEWARSGVLRNRRQANVAEALRTLGLQPGATLQEIQESYRRLIRRYHPDAGGSVEMAKKINAAFQTLKEVSNADSK